MAKMYSTTEFAMMYGVSGQTVLRWIWAGMPAVTVRTSQTTKRPQYRIRKKDAEMFLKVRELVAERRLA
jgi:hypothetical protein